MILYTSEVILTQNKVLEIAKELKPGIKWDINQVDSRKMLKNSLKQLSAGDLSTPVVLKIVAATAFAGDGYGSAYTQPDNDLLDQEDGSGRTEEHHCS